MSDADASGAGRQRGPLRPDWGEDWAELACDRCGASWVGPIGEACDWCAVALERMRVWQAEKLLQPELPDRDDARRRHSLEAWAERLARGVEAELITAAEARAAFDRHKDRRSA